MVSGPAASTSLKDLVEKAESRVLFTDILTLKPWKVGWGGCSHCFNKSFGWLLLFSVTLFYLQERDRDVFHPLDHSKFLQQPGWIRLKSRAGSSLCLLPLHPTLLLMSATGAKVLKPSSRVHINRELARAETRT